MKYFTYFSNLLFGLGIFGLSMLNWRNVSKIDDLTTQMKYYDYLEDEHDMIIRSINDINKRLSFTEEGIPEVARRNAKVKIVKALVSDNIKQTRENNFKSEAELNQYAFAVVDSSERFKIPVSLILAVSRVESNFNSHAVSPMRAKGVMQIMDDTMAACANRLNKSQYDPFYVVDGVTCGSWYLSYLKSIFGNINDTIRSYNCGPKTVKLFNLDQLPQETVNYHEKVIEYMDIYKEKLYWE
jgi:soluble lytic murein transglycosylase-like protein